MTKARLPVIVKTATSDGNSTPGGQSTAKSPVQLLRPIANPSLDKSVIDALIVMIEQAQLKVSDRLPPEQALASQIATKKQRQIIRQRADILLDIHASGEDWREVDGQFHAAIHDALGESSIPVHGLLADAVIGGDTQAAVQHMMNIAQIVDNEVKRYIDAE